MSEKNNSNQKKDDNINFSISNDTFSALLTPMSIVVGSIIIAVSLLFATQAIINNEYKIKGTNLSSGSGTSTGTTTEDTTPSTIYTSVNISNSPKQGNSKAKVAIVEFSDFNCSFCNRHHSEGVAEEITKNFVDTGDVLHVYRNYVSVGGANTEGAANAALCVRELSDDNKYFQLVNRIYNSESVGYRNADLVKTLAAELGGIDSAKLDECITNKKYATVVSQDTKDGSAAQVSGTPGFIVGLLKEDGTVEGELVPGAVDFATFQTTINTYLNK